MVERLRKKKYRKFTSVLDARRWLEQQTEWMKHAVIDDETTEAITAYTGEANVPINNYLRNYHLDHKLSEEMEYKRWAETLAAVVRQCVLDEDIVTYRYTHYKTVEKFCQGKGIRKGSQYTDPAFLSTTLCPKELKQFCKKHHCNCLMKIYLDKGSNGLAISSNSDPQNLDEMELLLPPDTRLEILRVYRLLRFCWIECKKVD